MISKDIGLCPTARDDGRITRNHVSSHLVFGAGGTAWAATGEESLAMAWKLYVCTAHAVHLAFTV